MPAATKRLTLVRHGQAEWKGPQVADADRPLTRRGQAEAAEMARRLRTQEFDYDVLVVDNASTDGTVNWLQESHPEVAMLRNFRNQ